MAPKTRFPQLKDRNWLAIEYIDKSKTMYEIATDLGCSGALVYLALKATDIQVRPHTQRINDWKQKACQKCESTYKPTGPAQRFCSSTCRDFDSRVCDDCRNVFLTKAGRSPRWAYYSQFFCSQSCRDKFRVEQGRQRGRSQDSNGYVRIRVPMDTPGVSSAGYIREHRYVMQQFLGRPLSPDETIHHINGDKTDNRLENLQLRAGKHGKGVLMQCQDCQSHNVKPVPL